MVFHKTQAIICSKTQSYDYLSVQDGSLNELVRKRYQSFDTEIGAQIEAGKADFEYLEKKAMEWGEPKIPSAKQVKMSSFSLQSMPILFLACGNQSKMMLEMSAGTC